MCSASELRFFDWDLAQALVCDSFIAQNTRNMDSSLQNSRCLRKTCNEVIFLTWLDLLWPTCLCT